jgi:hypothetical protein
MSYEQREQTAEPSIPGKTPMPNDHRTGEPPRAQGATESGGQGATVIVRGETVRDKDANSGSKEPQNQDKGKSQGKTLAEAKVKMKDHLPALDDDSDVGIQKDQVVTRDGKADLAFTGTLLASAAPDAAPKGSWYEYRVYQTTGGKHVFSKIKRSIYLEDADTHEAEIFDPAPSSMPSQLLRSARDLTHSKPLTWTDAAAHFFGYDPLAKDLYRKLSGDFEEHVG